MKNPGSKTGIIILVGSALIGIHYYIFQQFFPNNQGKLGHDYAKFIPDMLDGYYWFSVNGIFSVPWFTPSFCGGLPRFANPQGAYYSAPQFLSLVFDPLTSIKLTLLIFAALGFWGCYLLLRRVFAVTEMTGLLGATLFLFNGFYSSRVLVGHLTNHSFMVIPFILYWIFRPVQINGNSKFSTIVSDSAMAAFFIAYILFAGGFQLLPQVGLVIIIVSLICGIFFRETFKPRIFAIKFILTIGISVALCFSKLVAVLSYLKFYPRDLYPLPGIPNLWDLATVLMKSLFWKPPDNFASEVFTNIQWQLGRHEWEYGVTFIPLAILLFGGGARIYQLYCQRSWKWPPLGQSIKIGAIILLLLVPLFLNYYSPAWNSFLKSTPIIKNSSTLVRWFGVYIPVVILLASITIERIPLLSRYKVAVTVFSIIVVVGMNLWADREYYHANDYNPDEIIAGYYKARSGKWPPEITGIAGIRNRRGITVKSSERNNVMARGHSQLFCYEPIFGYRLENFPRKSLRPGPVMLERGGVLNIKNPACYVFPEENNCSPGDHFTVDQKRQAQAFVQFKSYPFHFSLKQKIANVVTLLTLFAYIFYFTYRFYKFLAAKV